MPFKNLHYCHWFLLMTVLLLYANFVIFRHAEEYTERKKCTHRKHNLTQTGCEYSQTQRSIYLHQIQYVFFFEKHPFSYTKVFFACIRDIRYPYRQSNNVSRMLAFGIFIWPCVLFAMPFVLIKIGRWALTGTEGKSLSQ